MTEVAGSLPADHRLAIVKHYEAGPPEKDVEPGETYATTKEEEWISKKKTEVTNTKQIETRVKRQVVLEDGKVVEDSGPQVTTNTTEDTETQEHHQTELRKLGDDEADKAKALEDQADGKDLVDGKSNWVAVPNPDGVVREVKERKVISREETEEVKETEDIQHHGDITDEDFLSAVKSGKEDLRKVLRTRDAGKTIVSSGPRVVKDTTKTNKVTDTEETRELSSARPDGKIVTETQRTTEHEELDDRDLPDNVADVNEHKESSQRYFKAREQEDVDYYADGVKIGHEMRFKAETTEGERRGDGLDDPDWDSLSARARRRANQRQVHRYRGVDGVALGASPLDRKDALTKRPLDFDQEEETRKVETSKWLENHFGSESRSSKDSIGDEAEDDKEHPPKTSFFNVTIKSTPTTTRAEPPPVRVEPSPPTKFTNRTYSQHVEPERDRHGGFFKGITEWSERRQDPQRRYSPGGERSSPVGVRRSPVPDYRNLPSPIQDYRHRVSPSNVDYRRPSPTPDYRARNSPVLEQSTPTPPQRKRVVERRQRASQESRYDSGYRTPSRTDGRDEPLEEPPPDYSPPSPPPVHHEKKLHQKTRFADTAKENSKETASAPKQKSGNIIGQSIRKLVGKIRSASAERKARQRAKRSPSPSYQAGHPIDRDIPPSQMMDKPVQRYYLGEDPFAGSIYGRENKYDGVRPARSSRRQHPNGRENGRTEYHEERSQSTLGRFSKSTSRLASSQPEGRISQTLPRHTNRYEQPTRLERNNRSNSTINVSIINTLSSRQNVPPAKPARTYRSNLSRSKSFNVQPGSLDRTGMYKSNPQLNRLNENPVGLKSPGLISSLSRSQRDLNESEETNTSRFATRNGHSEVHEHKKVFLKDLKNRAPELFKTLHENEDDAYKTTSILKSSSRYGGDIYEPPTRLRETFATSTPNTSLQRTRSPTGNLVLRRGSNSSDNYSETYHTTSRNDDPLRPSVTNTVQSFSKKTLPSKNGRALETIESSETRSVTKSHYRGEPVASRGYYNDTSTQRYGSVSPVVIEVRNYNRK